MATDANAPFGNPDGSRATLDDLHQQFIDFRGGSGLSVRGDDLTARVIVGRKGSGKTVYLRRLYDHAQRKSDLYAGRYQQDPPQTEAIIRFCKWFTEAEQEERWMLVWRRAIVRCVVTHLIHVPELRAQVEAQPGSRLLRYLDQFDGLLKGAIIETTIYDCLRHILHSSDTRNKIVQHLEDPLWDQLESLLGETLNGCKPLCFYIDAVDEEFENAPAFWLHCQTGLFLQTMRFLRDPRLGNRLHVIISIRDLILAQVYRGENQLRYRGSPHIRVLSWDREQIGYFLTQKISTLPDEFFLGDARQGKTLEAWLGQANIESRQGIREPLEDYLLRHTRLLPRDVVSLGNAMCNRILRHQTKRDAPSFDGTIRDVVAEAAKAFGDEQLAICSNHMASQIQMSSKPGTAIDQSLVDRLTDQLKRLIHGLRVDQFSYAELKEAQHGSTNWFEGKDPFEALWQNGLIGYFDSGVDEPRPVFYSDRTLGDFRFPSDRDDYLLHPSLIHSIGILGVSHTPVKAY